MSHFNAMFRQVQRERSIQREQERNAKRALFETDDDLDALADFDEREVVEFRERFACSRERDLYNDERSQSIFNMSAANPNDYL